MNDTYIALDELQPWADNYNHGDVDAIARSIARFGYNRTCSVWQQHTVMAGNHSVLALRQLRDTDEPAPANIDVRDGAWWIPFTSCAHLSFEEARAYAIADNETARRATRDEELLARYLQAALDAGGEDLIAATAITTDDLSRLLDTLPTEEAVLDEQAVHRKVEQAQSLKLKWQTELGQLWLIGEHRLLCGDATSADDVERLMNGERAVLFATDPPYLVDYSGADHPNQGNVDWSSLYRDGHGEEDALYDGYVSMAVEHALGEQAAWYHWHASRRQAMLEAVWERHGAFVHQSIIWYKNAPVLTYSDYLWAHEPCFYGWLRGHRPKKVSHEHLKTVWEIDCIPNSQTPDHPTPKPIELFAISMRMHTVRGEVCYEPFAGSGTQFLAAEQLGRRCYGLEKEPAFVAVILERLSEMGMEPVLEPT